LLTLAPWAGFAVLCAWTALTLGLAMYLLLYLFPIAGAVMGGSHLARLVQQTGPMTAGLAIRATTGLDHLPISPWAGLGVLAAWSAAALVAGGLLLCFRDA
jgi:ABC-2 type transport system permease protein